MLEMSEFIEHFLFNNCEAVSINLRHDRIFLCAM